MKKIGCLFLALCTVVAIAACSGDGRSRAPSSQTPSPPSGVSAPDSDAPPEDQVLYAFHLLLNFYVDQPDAHRLLSAAQKGALDALAPGFEPPAGLRLNLPGDLPGAESAFKGYFRALLSLAPADMDRGEVARAAIESMAQSLNDDHTYYMEPEAYELYVANETVGLGYSASRRPDGLLAWFIYPGGAGEAAGLRTGDVVLSIDGRPTARDPDDRDPHPLKAGKAVSLVISRPGVGRLELTATPQRSQRRILDWRAIGDIGYLRLYRFPPPTLLMPDGQALPAYFESALADLRRQGVKAWVLDLRNNPGGSEVVAANIAGRLGVTGALVENRRRGGSGATIEAIGQSGLGGLPLTILVNENSASSSELLVAALEQLDLARVFGQKTSGLVNTSRTWAVAGGGLFITTEHAFAGRDRSYLDGTGVAPDETVTLNREALAAGHDTQLERTIEWLHSRMTSPVGSR